MKHITDKIEHYYSDKILRHGSTPQGVDWNSIASQKTRFDQLLRIITKQSAFTINDLGCGYGALLPHMLDSGYLDFSYTGYDLSSEMLAAARDETAGLQTGRIHTRFRQMEKSGEMATADYTIASGIFNVMLDCPEQTWLEYIFATLDSMAECSGYGFSFNCLTRYSDRDRMRDYLYYADPCQLFDHCKRKYSRNVALLHDYGLYEFTILVRTRDD